MENRDRDNFLRELLNKNNEIAELKDKLRRRNMQIKELKNEIALIEAKVKTDDQLFPRKVI